MTIPDPEWLREFFDPNRITPPPETWPPRPLLPGLADGDRPPISVHKHTMLVHIPEELLMDEGLIPDTRPPVHIPWRRRIRWAAQDRIRQARLRVGSWIAGEDLDRDDYK